MWVSFLALACRESSPVSQTHPTDPLVTGTFSTDPGERRIGDAELLTRLSLDLRGIRPTAAELDAFEADPSTYDAVVEAWLADPRFGQRVADLWSEVYNSRNGTFFVDFTGVSNQTGFHEDTLQGSVAEEPLQVLAWLADHDEPYDQLVLADWTMADEVLAQIYPVDYPVGATGWQRVHYTDARPKIGILSSNGMWWYQGSMENNRNRGRANKVSRALLCDDYLEREIPFVPSAQLAGEEEQANAIRTNPSCTACHDTLDPLASHFYGFWWYLAEKAALELISTYRTEREDLWRELTGTPPGYFGQPSSGLVDLGPLVARDPRFTSCFVKQAWELVTRTDVDEVPVDLARVGDAFEENLVIRDVFRALVHLPEYQGWDERFTRRRVSPELLSSEVEELTGYRWTARTSDRDLVNAFTGYVLLAGGFDRDRVVSPAPTDTVTSVLVVQRLAENAAQSVVVHDRALPPEKRRLLGLVDFTETPDGPGSERMAAQLQALRRRVLGREVPVDGEEVSSDLAVWSAAHEVTGDPYLAWAAVLSLLLRDPDFVTY
jgi:hypothetical protein